MDPREGVSSFPLLSLPEKPLDEIIKNLQQDDLRKLRLVNHQLLKLVDVNIETIRLDSLAWDEIRPALVHVIDKWHRWPKLKILDVGLSVNDFRFMTNPGSFPRIGLESVAWADLEYLNLSDCGLTEAGGVGIAMAAKHWRKLRLLNLSKNLLYEDAITALSEVALPLLEDLNLNETWIGPATGAALANAAPQWPSLRKLRLRAIDLDDKGLDAFLSGKFPLLEDIDLSHNALQLEAGVAFANAAAQWPNLRVLNLSGNYIYSAGWQRLATAHFSNLEELLIGGVEDIELDPPAVTALRKAASRHWPRLRTLQLTYNFDLDISGFFTEGGWNALESLVLSGYSESIYNEVRDAVSIQLLPSLKKLDLSECFGLTSDSILVFFGVVWPNLQELYISSHYSDDDIAFVLARFCGNLPLLRILEFRDNRISKSAIDILMVAFRSSGEIDLSNYSQTLIFSRNLVH